MDRVVESEHSFEKVLREGRGPIYMDCHEASDEEVAEIRWGLNNEGNQALLTYWDEKGIDLRRDKIEFVDYKDVTTLRKFISDRGKIRSRRITGACRRHQNQIATAVKRARELALLPYVAESTGDERETRGRRDRDRDR